MNTDFWPFWVRLGTTVFLVLCAELAAWGGPKEVVLNRRWTHSHGHFDKSAAEVIAWSFPKKQLFVTNSAEQRVDILQIRDGRLVGHLDVSAYGRPNSVAVSDQWIAVAVANREKTTPGTCVFFDLKSGEELWHVEVGANPDMITVTGDGKTVLVANEGEPNEAYDEDPEGSVSIIDFSGPGGAPQARTADFRGFNPQRKALIERGVRISGPSKRHADHLATVAEDLEPEYIATSVDGSKAWITLQENNAIAVLDIPTGRIEKIFSCGLKNHNRANNGLDVSDRDGASKKSSIQIAPAPVWGLYQPDAIATLQHKGRTYLLTANEGDPRYYDGYSDVQKTGKLDPPKKISKKNRKRLARLEVSTANTELDSTDQLYSFGGRSFSILDSDGKLVFDSGDQLEREIAARWPEYFNSSNGMTVEMDGRSHKRGPEPEAVTVGNIQDQTYAFIGLERASVIAIYDVTDPEHPEFSGIHMGRNIEEGKPGAQQTSDLGPESMVFISAENAPEGKPLLAVAYEVSGTTTLYEIEAEKSSPPAQLPQQELAPNRPASLHGAR